jgi:RNA recognition motif-containing protein
MVHRVYVGNLPFSFTKSDLENMFQSFGVVKSTDIILDRETGRSRGFGFVELETAEQLAAAIRGLHGSPVNGRPLTVTEARERERGPGGPPRGPGGFAPRGDRPAGAPMGDRPPRSFERPAADRGPAAPRPGGHAPSPRVGGPGPGAAGPGGGPSKRERNTERRQPKMDGYERDHKDWRKYSDDDDGWQ